MDRTAHIVGTATTPMQRRDLTAGEMAHTVVADALADAEVDPAEVDLVVFGNATAGRLLDQACIRGQTFLLDAGLRNAGIINVDNSCAGGASALHLATMATLGGAGTVLAVGVEKMWTGDRMRPSPASRTGSRPPTARTCTSSWENPSGSVLMALNARGPSSTWRRGAPPSSRSLPQRSRPGVTGPSTRTPSSRARSPSRGPRLAPHRAAAHPAHVLVVHRRCGRGGPLHEARSGAPRIRASTVRSGNGDIDYHDRLAETAAAAWDAAGVDPADVDVVELHDATSAEELCALESLGLFKPGDAGPATVAGDTTLGGSGVTVNTSGGLVSRGHPLGATGIAQVVELTAQLRDQAGPRQVAGARLAVAANTGGMIGSHAGTTDAAFIGIHVLEAG